MGHTIKLAVQEQYLRGDTMAQKWEHAQALGFDAIELRGAGEGRFAARLPELRAAASAGVPMPTVCVEMLHFVGDFDPDRRLDAIKQMKSQLSVMADIGGRLAMSPASYGMFSTRLPPFISPRSVEDDRAVLLDGFGQLAEHAQRLGVTIAIEPLNRYENHMINTLGQAVDLCEQVGLPSFGIAADTYHMNIEEADLVKALNDAARWIRHIQLSDSNRLEPGAGHLDWSALLYAIDAIGYRQELAFECRLSGEVDEVLPVSVQHLRQLASSSLMLPTHRRISSDIGDLRASVAPLLASIYPDRSDEVCRRILALADDYAYRLRGRRSRRPTQSTTYLITYGDAIRRPSETALHTLGEVLKRHVGDVVSDVHLLPMFPWTSDDGFAVVDYRKVNPALGTWDDIAALAADYAVMFDFVANHVSSSSPWFVGWLAGDPAYDGFFLERDPEFDVSRVIRPRTTPLFHEYGRPDGTSVSVWTTFGHDQVDVNVAAPRALVELTDVLLGYVEHGASAVRLDAIGFLWKESGTTCLHLPQTHAIIKLWRAVLEYVAPETQLLTETNVPHAENVAYFGDGQDEANLVYQFALPPLVLHAFVSGRTTELSAWASGIGTVSPTATWFDFLASHDGIGLRATEGLLSDDDRQALVDRTLAHGGKVSMAVRPDGNQSVYELNINYLDALATPEELRSDTLVAQKALAAHSILLAFLGVPAIYYHSLFGSRSDLAGMAASGISRRINRQPLDADQLGVELQHDPRRRAVFAGISRLLKVRGQHAAFAPYGSQEVENHDPRAFVARRASGTPDEVVCATNVTSDTVTLPGLSGIDVIRGEEFSPLVLPPYGFAWLRPTHL